MRNAQKQAQIVLETLKAELKLNREEVARLKSSISELEKRQQELLGGWNQRGEIESAKLAVRDAAFPVFEPPSQSTYRQALRIVGVTDKTISLREDGSKEDEITRYSRETGKPPNSKYRLAIDIERALTVWENHLEELAKTTPQPSAK